MKPLTKAEFLSTSQSPMERVSLDAEPPVDFWNYFDQIPAGDFDGHDCSTGSVTFVWNDASRRYQHVLVNSEDKNLFMVIVLNIESCTIFGHRLLDLNHEYGIDPAL